MHISVGTPNSSGIAYTSVADKTAGNRGLGQTIKGVTGNYGISKTICVIKDHEYYRSNSSNVSSFDAYLIEIKLV